MDRDQLIREVDDSLRMHADGQINYEELRYYIHSSINQLLDEMVQLIKEVNEALGKL